MLFKQKIFERVAKTSVEYCDKILQDQCCSGENTFIIAILSSSNHLPTHPHTLKMVGDSKNFPNWWKNCDVMRRGSQACSRVKTLFA